MTNKQRQAMIKRIQSEREQLAMAEEEPEEIAPEAEDETLDTETETVDDNDDSQEEDDTEEIKPDVFAGIDFNIDNCQDQETITQKILYLTDKEKKILEEFKEKDQILAESVYAYLYNTIVNVFENYLTVLNQRLYLITEKARIKAEIEELEFDLKDSRRKKIDVHYQIRLLKYQNRLYNKEKLQELRIKKCKEKAQFLIKLQDLKACTDNNLPP